MPVTTEATYIKLHPRNVEMLRGNVTAAYLMQFFIQQCTPKAHDPNGQFEFEPVTLSVNEIQELTGIGWERIRGATTILVDRGFLEKRGLLQNANSKSVYLPTLNKITK